jgi:hypothetical protein
VLNLTETGQRVFLQAVALAANDGQIPDDGDGPTLSAARDGNNIVLSWSAPGMQLQQSSTITGEWQAVPGGTTSPVTVPMDNQQRFFRLFNQ